MSIEVRGMTPLVQVFDMDRSLRFYRDLLGFNVVSDSGDADPPSWVWLRKGDADLMLNGQHEIDSMPDAPPPDRTAWHGDTCLYFGCPDVDGAYQFLISNGIQCEPPHVATYGMKQLDLLDPDGYGICFQWPAEKG